MGYLIWISCLTLGLGVGAFLLIRHFVFDHRIPVDDGKGYFMLMMFIVTLLAGTLVFLLGPEPIQGEELEGISPVAFGILAETLLATIIMALGLLSIKAKKVFV